MLNPLFPSLAPQRPLPPAHPLLEEEPDREVDLGRELSDRYFSDLQFRNAFKRYNSFTNRLLNR
jgi:hypothetical protein